MPTLDICQAVLFVASIGRHSLLLALSRHHTNTSSWCCLRADSRWNKRLAMLKREQEDLTGNPSPPKAPANKNSLSADASKPLIRSAKRNLEALLMGTTDLSPLLEAAMPALCWSCSEDLASKHSRAPPLRRRSKRRPPTTALGSRALAVHSSHPSRHPGGRTSRSHHRERRTAQPPESVSPGAQARQLGINVLEGSVSSSSLRAVSTPAVGTHFGSSRPTCTSTLAWSQ